MINNHRFQILPPVVKNLLIINVLLFIATGILQSPPLNIDLTKILGLHYWRSELFSPWQIISYMFMHGNIPHILFNMFAVWMFGTHIENRWGSKRFLNYYLLTGFGAAFLHYLIIHFQIINLESVMNYDQIMIILNEGIVPEGISRGSAQKLFFLYNTPVVGASGSLFGILFSIWCFISKHLTIFIFCYPH